MSRDETPQPPDTRTSGQPVVLASDSPPRLAAAPTSAVSAALADHGSCMCAAAVGQGRLFEMDPTPIPIAWDWPDVPTDHTRRVGFWRRRTPDVFVVPHGVGPLLVMPDTNVLIDLHRNLDTVQGAAFLGDPTDATDWITPEDALRDLLAVWWWRDVRFHTGVWHLEDGRKAAPPHRAAALRTAVDVWAQDFTLRGDHGTILPEGVRPQEPTCPVHPDRPIIASRAGTDDAMARLPAAKLDRTMIQWALDESCHVFLTGDKKVLKLHPGLQRRGLAVHSPISLMRALRDSGELEPVERDLAPDLAGLCAVYGMRAEDDFEPDGRRREDAPPSAAQPGWLGSPPST